jgi:hypothetical protein
MRECRLGAQVGGSRKYGCSVSFCFLFCFFGWVGNEHFVEVFFVSLFFFFFFSGVVFFPSERTVLALSLASLQPYCQLHEETHIEASKQTPVQKQLGRR